MISLPFFPASSRLLPGFFPNSTQHVFIMLHQHQSRQFQFSIAIAIPIAIARLDIDQLLPHATPRRMSSTDWAFQKVMHPCSWNLHLLLTNHRHQLITNITTNTTKDPHTASKIRRLTPLHLVTIRSLSLVPIK
jgi:hypothetical protein